MEINYSENIRENMRPFTELSNIRLNSSAWRWLRGKATLFASFDAPAVGWENLATIKYDAFTRTETSQLADEARIATQVLANSLAVRTPALDLATVPFGEISYLTEISPGKSSATGRELPRRQDAFGTAGIVTRGAGFLREAKLGIQARQNLAYAGKSVEPGGRLGLTLGHNFGPLDVSFAGQVDGFLPAATDDATDIGVWTAFDLSAKLPLGGGLALRAGVEGIAIRGKVPSTDGFGVVFAPLVGVTYGATWKPISGVIY